MFAFCNNPIAALMIGWLFTVIISSSSTTTSIVVSMCAAGALDLSIAAYIIMGSNIGTALEGVVVSYGYVKNGVEFRRAAAGATVNDFFNLYSACLFLPIEWIWGAFNKGCGMYCTIAKATTKAMSGESKDADFDSPLDLILDPFCELFVKVNKDVYKAFSYGCDSDSPHCTVNITGDGCFTGDSKCILAANWHEKYDSASIIKTSFLKDSWGFSDIGTGIFLLFFSIACVICFLILLVWVLKFLVLGKANKYLKKALNMNPYIAMIIGCGVTIVIQSSSVVTSSLVPLVGVGVLTVEGILPMTLGANIGTTLTALIAALATGSLDGLAASFIHIYYNIIGVILFYPYKKIRKIIVNSAYLFGKTIQKYKWFGVAYIIGLYICFPAFFLTISVFIGQGGGLMWTGISLLIVLVLIIIGIFTWIKIFNGDKFIHNFLKKSRSKTPEEIAEEKGKPFPVEDCIDFNLRSKKWRKRREEQQNEIEKKQELKIIALKLDKKEEKDKKNENEKEETVLLEATSAKVLNIENIAISTQSNNNEDSK